MCRECCGTCRFVVKYVVDCRDTQRSLFWNSPGLCLDNNKQMRGHRPPTGRHPQSALPRLWLNKSKRTGSSNRYVAMATLVDIYRPLRQGCAKVADITSSLVVHESY
ncbi:hypothetical protein Bbelb_111130 [Branchiostoma belcheri]|nr:hypothetical protein Bbelb_111130 [Branchiostoma belcheri]